MPRFCPSWPELPAPSAAAATERDDLLHGTPRDDRLHGLEGDDSLFGRRGDDSLFGGDNDDALFGGRGDDILSGGNADRPAYDDGAYVTGEDSLFGGGGDDTLFGGGDQGSADDRMSGGRGDDVMFGGTSYDDMYGGTGDDLLHGGNYYDVMAGGAGNDTIMAGIGWDKLVWTEFAGPRSNDLYIGGLGYDSLTLNLTRDTWLKEAVQAELQAFHAAAQVADQHGVDFRFVTLGLTVSSISYLFATVDGAHVELNDEDVTAQDDDATVFVDDPFVTGNVLANDTAPNYAAKLVVREGPGFGSVTIAADGTFTYALDTTDPTVAALGQGDILVDSFIYKLTDTDGDSDKATVTLSITNNSPATGPFGFVVVGQVHHGNLGGAVGGGGDLNGDGIDDIALKGEDDTAIVIFGQPGGYDGTLDQSALDGTNGTLIDPGEEQHFGYAVAIIGDLNADGIDDLVVTDPFEGQGHSYVVFGSDAPVPAEIDVKGLPAGSVIDITSTAGKDQRMGDVVAAAVDVNGDGIDDLLVGSYFENGSAYVVFGRDTGFEAELDLKNLDAADGFRISGKDGAFTGSAVAGVGDVNGDGIDDFLIGAPDYKPAGAIDSKGAAYVVFGRTDGFGTDLDLESLDGSDGFRLEGDMKSAMSTADDVHGNFDFNGDGLHDLLIESTNDGPSYLVFGRDTATTGDFAPVVNMSLFDGSDGFAMMGAPAGAAGDVNGDGYGDIFAWGDDGALHLIFGRNDGFGGALDFATLTPDDGYRFTDSSGMLGGTYSTAGDINGDGHMDFLLGRDTATVNGIDGAGTATIVYGGLDNLAAFDSADGLIDGQVDLAYILGDPLAF